MIEKMAQQDIDIQYDPDSTKLRLLVFNSPNILINGNLETMSDDGLLATLSINDIVSSIYFDVKSVDNYGNDASLVSLEDYYYQISYSIIPSKSALPPGLSINYSDTGIITDSNLGYSVINGTVESLAYSTYEFLIRASLSMYDKDNNLIRVDDTDLYCYFSCNLNQSTFYWDPLWLNTFSLADNVYNIGSYSRGEAINIATQLSNLDLYEVTYGILSAGENYINPQNLIVPEGFHIDSSGIIDGIISASNQPGVYYFKLEAYSSELNSYGDPDTRNYIFSITVLDNIIIDNSGSIIISWITDSGSLGSTFETYPSHFSISASSPSTTPIQYSLSPNSKQLPGVMYIDSNTGMIMGNCPEVDSNTTYVIQIRASIGSSYSDRIFSFTVLPLFSNKNIFGIDIPVTGTLRTSLENISWNSDIIPDEYVYRLGDPSYGRVLNQNIYLINGLLNSLDTLGYWDTTLSSTDPNYGVGQELPSTDIDNFSSCFLDKLRNYHHPYDIKITGLTYSKGYSPDGTYLYDVIYLTVDDVLGTPGGFDDKKQEILITDDKIKNYDKSINQWNMPESSTRIFPASILNCRYDLMLTSNRINEPTYMIRPNSTSGIGLAGTNEGLPLWMGQPSIPGDNTSILGFTSGIVLAYVKPENGPLIISNIEQSNIDSIIGQIITVDRYIIKVITNKGIHFDLAGDVETTFDCLVDQNNSLIKSTGTWFDIGVSSNQTVIKFPPGDDYGF